VSTHELAGPPPPSAADHPVHQLLPFRDPSRRRRLLKIIAWLVAIAAVLVVLNLLGVDVWGWLSDLWDEINNITFQDIVMATVLQLAQTSLMAFAWFSILIYAYPGRLTYMQMLAAYATSVGLNNVLPYSLGTLVMLLMLLAIIAGSTFPGIFAAYLVQKIFFTLVGGLIYLYIFLAVQGSFDVSLGFLNDKPIVTVIVVVGGAILLVIALRLAWSWVKKQWEKAKEGGKILTSPGRYLTRVFLPQTLGYMAKIGVIIVFLSAYSIPVTFKSVMAVLGSNSLASVTSATPGGVGVNQAANVVALQGFTDAETATAYSISQQLVVTCINILFAILLVVIVFGWAGGKQLVGGSYTDAKVKAADMKSERHEKRQEKKRAKHRRHGQKADETGEPPADAPPSTSLE
jgi:uncharacterized membrane protein YbhN (UPF0104 family)